MNPTEYVSVHIEHGILELVIDRPERKNALTGAMYQRLADALFEAMDDPKVRVAFIHGTQDFTAGNDLQDFLMNPPQGDDPPVAQFLRAIAAFNKPLVAAVAGVAVGVGVTMLMHCDLVYAADTAKLSMPFVSLGLCPEAASSLLLPRIAGYQQAAEKLLLGEPFSAEEAWRIGLVNRVLPEAELLTFARAQCTKLTALPPASVRTTKQLLRAELGGKITQRMVEETQHFRAMLAAPEAREAMTAFMQKRKPDFSKFE